MDIVFDIDGTICNNTDGLYGNAVPYKDIIAVINGLFDSGNYIVFYTARGMKTCAGDKQKAHEMWFDFTFNQITAWGVKFHELHLGKVHGDLYVDDKAFAIRNDGSCAIDISNKILEMLR